MTNFLHSISDRAFLTIALIPCVVLAGVAGVKAVQSASADYSPAPKQQIESQIDWHDPDADCYLTFAEIERSDHGTTDFVTRDGNVYQVDGEYSPDFPYMLTMYGNHTEDVTNDEVCVVWMCVEGALG